MKIVIDISDKVYEDIVNGIIYTSTRDVQGEVTYAVQNGTPLPKGHGRIVDVGTIDLNQDEFISQSDYYTAECAIENAPTIIEANEESEDKE